MMELSKYKNDGWGLSNQEFTDILDIINKHDKDILKVAEFGSGISTQFFVDVVDEGIKNLSIDSFDDNPTYAFKGTHKDLNLMIRPLVECTDESYNKMFKSKSYDKKLMNDKVSPLHSRQKNNFYDIKKNDLNGIYDLMILDGPNGNGRNISYLHMKKHLGVGSFVLIDDYTHYDFVDKFLMFFDAEKIYGNNSGSKDQWNNGGDYEIYKIIKIK